MPRISKTINEITQFLQAESNGIGSAKPIVGICQDSRRVLPGSLFVCISGKNADGHNYAEEVIAAGAEALLVEKYLPYDVPQIKVANTRSVAGELAAFLYGRPARQLTMVGVTGTNGKTTVTILVKQIAAYSGQKTGLIGTLGVTVNNHLVPGSRTTPEAVDTQGALRRMADEGVELVAMEVSSHALHQGRINGCVFDAMIFTNLTQDHLDYHENMDNYLEAKSLAFSQVDFNKENRFSLLNGDDFSYLYLRDKAASRVITYGIDGEDLDYRAENIIMSGEGVEFDVLFAQEGVWTRAGCIKVQTPGRFSVYNALAAFAWARESGYPEETIRAALAEIDVPGRFESIRCGQDFQVIVDYAHTPDGLLNVLATAREITPGRLICVFGCGGDRDQTKRPLMGQTAASLSDYVIVTSDNPRTEDPMAIIDDILPGLLVSCSEQDYEIVPDRYKAIMAACRLARTGDTVMLAGKGHEDYQIMGKEKTHFDDREVAAEILRSLQDKIITR